MLDGQTVTAWKDLSGSGLHLDTLKAVPTYIQPGHGDWFWPDEFDVSGALALGLCGLW